MEVETMAMVCKEIQEWVEEEISQPIEEWEERQEKKCKKYHWYDPRGWFCWFVTILVKVIRWVVVTVGKWVIRTVCYFLATVVGIIKDVFSGLWDIIVGIFTLDWRRILDGFIKIVVGVLKGFFGLVRIFLLGDTIDFIIGEINKGKLRDHVRKLFEAKYSGDTLNQIKDAIRLDHGAFGLRLNATAFRTILDSETLSPTDPTTPNLVVLHETGQINLRELCGFEFTEGFWNRKRYKTLKKETVLAGGGGGEFDNPISENDLNIYLNSRGSSGPAFIVISMRDGVLDTKLRAAEEKGRELGLMIRWEKTQAEVTHTVHIKHNGFDTGQANASLDGFLADIIVRTRKSVDGAAATAQLCNPVAVGIFRYTDTLRGLANNLVTSKCKLPERDTSGVTFIDNTPDHFWKYVPIHELGHYFGLCHVDGIDRIMVSTREKSWWSSSVIPNLLYLKGEPYFTLDEAKSTWDYIVANFEAQCLGAKPVAIP
jgi:hypothetical protein